MREVASWILAPRTQGLMPGTGGRFGPELPDFQVEEIPAYLPQGEGEHTWVLLQKEGWSTPAAVRVLSRSAGVRERDVGVAGLKDRNAVTVQWASFPPGCSDPASWRLPDGIALREVTRHRNKLRRGHLHGNRFTIRLVDVERPEAAEGIAAWLREEGTWNTFGPQRFGESGENVAQALRWLRGEIHGGNRERFYRAFLPSVLQSAVFNRWVGLRAARGLSAPLPGEVVRLKDTGSHFRIASVDAEMPRWVAGDLLPTGPIFGPKGLQAEDEARALEDEALSELGLSPGELEAMGRLAPGARRDLLLRPDGLSVEPGDGQLTLHFELPAGAYATTVVREFTQGPWSDTRGDDA